MNPEEMDFGMGPGGPDGFGGPGGPEGMGGPGGPGGGFPGRGGFKELKVESDWIITESAEYPGGITLKEGSLPVAPDKLAVLMTVDSVAVPIEAGEYAGKVVLTVYEPMTIGAPSTSISGGTYRTALFVKNGEVDTHNSLTAAVTGGAIEKNKITGISIKSDDLDYFNGIIIDCDDPSAETLTLADSSFEFFGDGNSEGSGACITTIGSAKVKIDNINIKTMGKASSIIASGETKVEITDSVIYGQREPGSPKMCPWVLGLNGNNRVTNAIENAVVNYHDSIVVAESWAALSTDSGRNVKLHGENMFSGIGTLEEYNEANKASYTATPSVKGKKYGFTIGNSAIGQSGYVNYADGFHNTFKDVEFYAPDYIFILSTAKASIDVYGDSKIHSGRHGVMWHKNQGGSVNLYGGKWYAERALFQSKSYAATDPDGCWCYANADGTDITLGNEHVLYQLMTSDDIGLGPKEFKVPEIESDWSKLEKLPETSYVPKYVKQGPFGNYPVFLVNGQEQMVRDLDSFKAQHPDEKPVYWDASNRIHNTYASFKNLTVSGDIYNAVWERIQELEVSLVNCKLTGVISSSNTNHTDADGNFLPGGYTVEIDSSIDTHLIVGRVRNTVSPTVNNPLSLKLSEGSIWTVTGTSYLTSLSIDATSKITACCGAAYMTVNGVPTAIEAKEYKGEICIGIK